jgi:hypothetical protein
VAQAAQIDRVSRSGAFFAVANMKSDKPFSRPLAFKTMDSLFAMAMRAFMHSNSPKPMRPSGPPLRPGQAWPLGLIPPMWPRVNVSDGAALAALHLRGEKRHRDDDTGPVIRYLGSLPLEIRSSSVDTITFPIGHSARPASFKCAQAKGIPMMVTASSTAVTR